MTHCLLYDDNFAHSNVVECAFMISYAAGKVSDNPQDLVRVINHIDELDSSSVLWVSQSMFEKLSKTENWENISFFIVEEVTSKFFESSLESLLVA